MGYFARLITLLLSILFSLYLVWFGLKSYGENLPASDFQTELVKKLKNRKEPTVWLPWDGSNSPEFTHISSYFLESQWRTGPSKEETTLLEAIQSLSPTTTILLNINVNSPQALPALRAELKSNGAWSRIVFCSRSDGILKDLRALEPEWTFCSGEIFMTRMLGLSSLGLQSLNRISADIFFIHLNQLNLKSDLLVLIEEARRQNKLTFLGPVSDIDTSYPADGWVIKK